MSVEARSIPQVLKGGMVSQGTGAVAGRDGRHSERRRSGADELRSPAVGGVNTDRLSIQLHLDAGEAGPPDRDQLAVAWSPSHEAGRGEQPVDPALVPPSADDDLAAGAPRAPAPPTDPASPRPCRLAGPVPKARLAPALGNLPRVSVTFRTV